MLNSGQHFSRILFTATFILLLSAKVFSQTISDNQIKAGLIYNFQKNFTWIKENKIDTFRIGVYGENTEFITILKSMQLLRAKNKPIKIIPFKSIADITYTHILIITNDRNFLIKDIFELIKGKNTLLITDLCEYQRYIMINFIYNANSKIQFEINSKNVEEADFLVSPKLILLGGTEIDVRKLYLETEKSLLNEKEKVESFSNELLVKKREIQDMNIKLKKFYSEIETLQNNIAIQKKELSTLSMRSKEQKTDLENKSLILSKQKTEIQQQENKIIDKNTEITERQKEISKYSQVLSKQKDEIEKHQDIINNQGKSLISQLEKIKTQQTFLYLLIALVLMTIVLAIVIYRNYSINRIRNLELEKLSIVARETDNAVVIMNETGDFEWINEGFTRLYGYTLEQFVQKKGKNLLQSSANKSIQEVFDYIISKKKSISYESSAYTYNGVKIWTQTTLTPILDGNKNIKKLIIIDSDITQLKEAELNILEKSEEIQRQSEELFDQTEQLMGLNEELMGKKNKLEEALEKLKNTQSQLVESEKMVILGQLTAGIAHEINNPINFINSGIEYIKIAYDQVLVLLNKYEQLTPANVTEQLSNIEAYKKEVNYNTLLDDIAQIIKDIKSGISRTIEIIKSLRTFSRIDESDLKPIDLHKSIDSTLVILKNKFSNRIDIIKSYGIIPQIECYPGKINQLLLNIIVNAIQSIKNNGQITIKTSLEEINSIEFIKISIRDTGTGMTEDVKKKIFEPFFTTKDAGEGTGLGLSISHNIVEKHNGSINVDSKPGEGTIFTILLPVIYKKKNKSIIFEESNT